MSRGLPFLQKLKESARMVLLLSVNLFDATPADRRWLSWTPQLCFCFYPTNKPPAVCDEIKASIDRREDLI